MPLAVAQPSKKQEWIFTEVATYVHFSTRVIVAAPVRLQELDRFSPNYVEAQMLKKCGITL
ncbi:hypothetical protein D3C72_2008150 [compost metagenome]